MEELSLQYYLFVFKLRRKIFIPVFVLMVTLTSLFAARWSSYQAEALIQVSQPQINEDSSSSSSNRAPEDLADLRISYLQQKVLSINSLIEIINKFNLYQGMREKMPITAVANKMASNIKISMQSASLANPASAQKATASQLEAMTFTIDYKYSDPSLAQQVTNELVTRFLDEDIKQRRDQAKETSAFLQAQIDQLEKSLRDQEKKIAEIRSANGASRPDALAFNQQAMASSMQSLQNLETQIASLLGTIGSLKGQLAATDPYSRVVDNGNLLTTPTVQLRALRTQYASLSAQYGPKHPDVIKARHQLEALEAQIGDTASTAEIPTLKALITDVETKLATAQKTYGPQNPEVQSLTTQLEKLNTQLKATIEKMPAANLVQKDADNPVYLQLSAQLEAANKQYNVLLNQKAALQAQVEKYQKAVMLNPGIEQQLTALARDYENDNLHYRDLKSRKMQADITSSIETESVGKRLIVLTPPEMPSKTTPPQMILFLGGIILSLFAGLTAVIGFQIFSQSVVGPQHVEMLTGTPPLVVVPRLKTPGEKFSYWRQYRKQIIFISIAIIVFLALISIFVMPLDEILNKLTDALS